MSKIVHRPLGPLLMVRSPPLDPTITFQSCEMNAKEVFKSLYCLESKAEIALFTHGAASE